jgi:putative membrane protein
MYGRGYYGARGCFDWFGSSPWFMWGGMLMLFVIAALIVILFIKSKDKVKHQNSDALEILKIKLVKGEITEEEYLRKREILLLK